MSHLIKIYAICKFSYFRLSGTLKVNLLLSAFLQNDYFIIKFFIVQQSLSKLFAMFVFSFYGDA